jgi:hypothetical protein
MLTMKLRTSMKAGNPESIRNFANTPGLTHIFGKSQLVQVSMFSQPFATATGLFRGLESKRIDDHQKYRLGVRWISRSTRNEWIVTPAQTVKPIRGKINLQRKRMVIQTPSLAPKFRTR